MKKNYQKPAMTVVQLQYRSHILTGSDPVKSVKGSDGFTKKEGGWHDNDDDM